MAALNKNLLKMFLDVFKNMLFHFFKKRRLAWRCVSDVDEH